MDLFVVVYSSLPWSCAAATATSPRASFPCSSYRHLLFSLAPIVVCCRWIVVDLVVSIIMKRNTSRSLSILPKNCSRLFLPTGQEKSDLQCTPAGVSSYSFITPPLRPWVVFSVSQYDDDTHTHAGIVIVSKRQVIECVFRRGSWLIYPTSSVHFCKCELNHLTRSHISNSNNNS